MKCRQHEDAPAVEGDVEAKAGGEYGVPRHPCPRHGASACVRARAPVPVREADLSPHHTTPHGTVGTLARVLCAHAPAGCCAAYFICALLSRRREG